MHKISSDVLKNAENQGDTVESWIQNSFLFCKIIYKK